MNFPLIRYKNFQAWVPATDIDEVDAKTEVLTDVVNVDFKNGYIETTIKPVTQTHPPLISTDISNGYDLLSMKGFHHSIRGDTGVYILWKESTKDLKIYINGVTLLNLDEQNSDITFIDTPNNINYNLVNDQFKINLNCLAKFNTLNPGGEETLLNLTLVYLEAIDYDIANGINRVKGWYCFPRWLGWTYPNSFDISVENYGILSETEFPDDTWLWFVDEPITGSETDFFREMYGWERIDEGSDDLLSLSTAENLGDNAIVLLPRTFGIREFEFSAKKSGSESNGARINIYLMDFAGLRRERLLRTWTLTDNWAAYSLDYYNELLGTSDFGKPIGIIFSYIPNPFGGTSDARGYVDNIRLTMEGIEAEVVIGLIVGKYFDGQRALLASFGNVNISNMSINKNAIDWRIVSYEVYARNEGVFILKQIWDVDDTWTESGSNITKAAFITPPGVKTLNYNYNLPEDVRVDNQRNIYQEVSHKGRVYFVNEDFKVYQSHILPNLALQADSFPYDEDVGFGFFIVDQSRVNKGIAVTPTNYLAILTDAGLYVYFIQPSRTGVFKILRLTSGSIGLSSRDSVARSLTGDPTTDGLFWIDYNGIYFYVGDSQPPKNLILGTHEEYWRNKTNTEKDNAVGFYNPLKREYWLQIGDDILAFELPYNKWKKHEFGSGAFLVSEFYGVFNNNLYYRSGNTFVKYDVSIQEYPYFTIKTAYNTTSNVSEIYDKILQELYVIFADSDSAIVKMAVWVDGRKLDEVYQFSSSNRYDIFLAPLGIRFNRIKFVVGRTSGGKRIRIKEFGCSYSEDNKEMLGNTAIERDIDTGYGFDYGENYGG